MYEELRGIIRPLPLYIQNLDRFFLLLELRSYTITPIVILRSLFQIPRCDTHLSYSVQTRVAPVGHRINLVEKATPIMLLWSSDDVDAYNRNLRMRTVQPITSPLTHVLLPISTNMILRLVQYSF